MRTAFHQYFQPAETFIEQAWKDGFIAYDASALLNIYGYSTETRDGLVALIEKSAPRVHQPYQFGLEYARQRSSAILKQVGNYQSARRSLEDVRQKIQGRNNHPFLSEASLTKYREILDEFSAQERELERLVGADPYAERLLKAFESRIGPKPSPERLMELHAQAQQRYDSKIPPGYEDQGEKPERDAYGDYIGWRQLMEIAMDVKSHALLVIDDVKADWWQRHGKDGRRIIGPEPRLREEFFAETGQHVFLYTSEYFLRTAKAQNFAEIRTEMILDVAESLEVQRGAQLATEPKRERSSFASEKSEVPAITEELSLTKGLAASDEKKSAPLTKGA